MSPSSRARSGVLSLRTSTVLPGGPRGGGLPSAPPLRQGEGRAGETLRSRLRIRSLPSPHHRDRGGAAVDLIVLHHITCPPGHFGTEDVESLFLGTLDTKRHPAYGEVEGRQLSAHFLVDRRGRVTQFVGTDRAAYHAGASRWRGRDGCNDFSVGIEMIGDAAHAFTARQYTALARLCRDLMRAHPAITPRRIVGHGQVAWPRGRKSDPGPRFDWERLHRDLAALGY